MTRLLAPRFFATRNVFRRAPLRTAILAVLLALFWGVAFALVTRVLG